MSKEVNDDRLQRCSKAYRVRAQRLRHIVFLRVIVATVAGGVAFRKPASGQADGDSTIILTKIPDGYRNWTVISVAHEEGNVNSLGASLGNDVAIKAFREGKLPFPDGTIIAALHWRHTSSEENNKVFGQSQSFVAGPATNVQFMVKDSTRYAATGGWGFGHCQNGRPATDEAFMNTCFPCPALAKNSDLVFTHYARADGENSSGRE